MMFMKKKRKMPKHIVLPNGMWRFVKSGAKTTARKRKYSFSRKLKRKTKRRVSTMPRRYKRRARRTAGGLIGRGSIMSGIVKPKGLLAAMVIGVGAASIAEQTGITNAIPFGKYLVAGATGGVGGLAGVFVKDMISGGIGTATQGLNPYAVY